MKKFFFFLFLRLKFNSLFFHLILYHTFHFSCKNFEIHTVQFLEINSLICRNEYQISTIKGYRSVISNTLKFKTGNRIGSNPVLSELIRSFELQRPVQRSLTPKWDLSWVLICLQKAPYEPLHKASKLHVALMTVFFLALVTAKRCSEIHALTMDSEHLRFNQSTDLYLSWSNLGFWLRINFHPFVKILL